MENYIWLVPLGFLAGAYGTLIGAGGGFLLVPALLLLGPNQSPETITSVTLAVALVNGISGSLAYARLGRIDYRSGLLFAAATIPGAVLGALTTGHIPRRMFDLVFALVLIGVSVFSLVQPGRSAREADPPGRGHFVRHIVETNGSTHSFSYDAKLGVAIGLLVGYISSALGVGGGIVHVPAMVFLLSFPPHVATATSQFILTLTTLAGTSVHLATGDLFAAWASIPPLAIGVLLGAQLGAQLSSRLQAAWIVRAMAVALGIVGLRILFLGLWQT